MSRFASSRERRLAFEAEALPHLGRVLGAARRLTAHAAEAEDATQETFLRAYRTFENFETGTNARAWLFTILYSVCSNRRRKTQKEPIGSSEEDLESQASRLLVEGDWEAPLLEMADLGVFGTGPEVEAALLQLSAPARAVVLLVDLEELTYEEAAEVLGCPVGTVRSRLSRARRQLAVELAHYAKSRGFAGRREV